MPAPSCITRPGSRSTTDVWTTAGVRTPAWISVNGLAGHIHGEDGCTGCDGSRGDVGHDWEARMRTITELQPDITKWFDRDVWTRAVNDAGYAVTRR